MLNFDFKNKKANPDNINLKITTWLLEFIMKKDKSKKETIVKNKSRFLSYPLGFSAIRKRMRIVMCLTNKNTLKFKLLVISFINHVNFIPDPLKRMWA